MSEALVPYQAQAMSLTDTMQLGQAMAQSGYFADSKDAAQAVVKILAGRELGFGPVASMTGINVIKGKITLSANLIAASVKRSGRYNYRIITMADTGVSIDFFEGNERVGNSTFTLDDAKKAGLTGDNWKKFPRNMLFARAMSNGAKWYCPDLSGGPIYTPDELGAEIDGETGEVISPPIAPTDLHAPVDPPQGRPKNGKTVYGSPQKLVDLCNKKIGGEPYYNIPHLKNTIGGVWPDWTDAEAVKQVAHEAVDYGKQRRAEQEATPDVVDEIDF